MPTAANGQRDGRTVRAERTRQALVDALLSLLYEGQLQPTAERIAVRAGVSERSVFQHFPDREALFQAVAVSSTSASCRRWSESTRRCRCPSGSSIRGPARAALERSPPVRRAALLLEHESEVVAGWLQSARRQKAREVERVFRRELDAIEPPERARAAARALVAHCAWTAWEALAHPSAPERGRSRAAVRATLTALLSAQR